MHAWRNAWRKGIAPVLSTPQLEALRKALVSDDPKLIQGATTKPPPLHCMQDMPVEGGCLLAFCGWQSEDTHLCTVGEVEDFFARLCHEVDMRLDEPAGVRYLLNWYDDTPRAQMISELLPEVELELSNRQQREAALCPLPA
jgi:hypothetical protein